MLLLKPIRHDTIWGGPKITRYTGVEGEHIGHLYSLYCRPGSSNEILNGPWQGRRLNDVFPLFRDEFAMGHCDFFPLTLALTEADQNLSIQVHPDDRMAASLEPRSHGKRESWYFIEAPESGTIINGCTCTDSRQMHTMISDGRFLEMADTLKVAVGDYVFVEPGTMHAITAGSLVYEIEEGSDHTYRFYDYDRRDADGNLRQLHVEEATQALHLGLKSRTRRYQAGHEIVERTYATRLVADTPQHTNLSGTLECFTLVAGHLVADGLAMQPGSTAILWPGETLLTHNVQLAFTARYYPLLPEEGSGVRLS